MADPLSWKAGEGYDIHVLRGGSASKSLPATLSLPANHVPSTLKFVPQLGSSLSTFGLSVTASTGEVTATALSSSQKVINNFLMTVLVQGAISKSDLSHARNRKPALAPEAVSLADERFDVVFNSDLKLFDGESLALSELEAFAKIDGLITANRGLRGQFQVVQDFEVNVQ